MFKKCIVHLILTSFFFTSIEPMPDASAQVAFLPAPGTMVNFSSKFDQAILKGIVFHPENPFKFDFILDEGDSRLNEEQAKAQSQKIASYFLASLTTPEKEIWVNLSPFEKNRIIPASFGGTLMGQNLLAQDYMLKQIMATALYPERQLGKEFWQKVYKQAREKFGTTDLPFNTFNKVWIVPDKAVVHENTKMNAVFVEESSLKVMLEKDYLAQDKHKVSIAPVGALDSAASTMSAAVIKELVIPALEKEVNEGKNFAPLRQVYHALILAKWYKENLRDNIIAKGYIDRRKIKGLGSRDKQLVFRIYHQYLKAYRKGVFNFIKDDFDENSQSVVPRKYFSGGFMGAVHITKSDRAMSASGFKRAFIATILLTVAAFTPALAQAPSLAAAVGVQSNRPVAMSAQQKRNLLSAIEQSTSPNPDADPRAAAMAFRQITDTSAAEYAASILRLYSGGNWDKPLSNLLSNSSGPGFDAVSGNWSMPLSVTSLGIAQSFSAIVSTFMERSNVGESTLRLEAALYLLRVSDQLDTSNFWERLSNRGVFESLMSDNEKSDTVMAARMLVMAAMIKHGNASRNVGGFGIVNLDKVAEKLKSDNWMVRLAALSVFDSIAPGDLDNRYQGLLEEFLRQAPQDIVTLELGARIAAKHGMITALPNIMRQIEVFSKAHPSAGDIVALRNWHARMYEVMKLSLRLSNGNSLAANLNALGGQLTASGSTDTVNSLYLGFLFTAVQDRYLTAQNFLKQLNNLRSKNGLRPVAITDIQIKPIARGVDLGASLAELKNGENPELNVSIIVEQGGPMYFADLLGILQETNDVGTVRAILSRLDPIFAMGVNTRNNPWVAAMDAKAANHPNLDIRQLITDYEQSRGLGDAVSRALGDMSNRAGAMMALEALASSNTQSKDNLQAVIRFVFLQRNPALDSIENGQTSAFSDFIALAARVMVVSGASDTELHSFFTANAFSNETGMLTKQQLELAIAAIRAGKDARSVLNQDWASAEKIFLSYLRGADGVTAVQVARAIEAAQQIYKRPSDPGSEQWMERFLSNSAYNDPADMMKMVEVFSKFRDMSFGFELLSKLLNHFPQVDEKVISLFRTANAVQRQRSAPRIVEAYLSAFDRRDIRNPDTLRTELRIRAAVNAIKDDLSEAIQNRTNTATDRQRRALLGLRNPMVLPAEISYVEALAVIFDPNASEADLRAALSNMLGMKFPTTALEDLTPALQLSEFGNPEYKRGLIDVIAAAQKQLAGTFVAGDTYQGIRDQYLKAFQDAQSTSTQVTAIKLFLSAPPEIAGDLFWEGINRLKERYSQFGVDEQQRENFFDVLKTMRDVIDNLKRTDVNKYNAIVDFMKNKLQEQSTVKRFNNGVQYLFLQSIDPNFVNSINLGIDNVSGGTDFLRLPNVPYYSWYEGERVVSASYLKLAKTLNRIIAQAGTVAPGTDPLVVLEDLFNPSEPVRQIAAMKALGPLTLFFLNTIPEDSGDTLVFKLYLLNKIAVSGNNPELILPFPKDSLEEAQILYMGQLINRGGVNALAQVRKYLQDDDNLLEHDPAVLKSLIDSIGIRGDANMVEPLLKLYVEKNLTHSIVGAFGVSYSGNVIGFSIEDALVKMGKRDKVNVIDRIQKFQSALAIGNQSIGTPLGYNFTARKNINGIIDRISSDRAMTNGGIDLGDVNVQSQNSGDVRTAFDGPAQLDILMKADGLIPNIERIQPLTQSAANQLLGSL